METDKFIKILAADAVAVRRLDSLYVRTGKWLLLAIICMLGAVVIVGVRQDIGQVLGQTFFVAETIAVLVLGIAAGMAALSSGVADDRRTLPGGIIPLVLLAVWLVLLTVRFFGEVEIGAVSPLAVVQSGMSLQCAVEMLELALIPAVVMIVMIKRAAPTKLGWSGFYAVLGAMAFAQVALQFLCPQDAITHLWVSHVVPVLVLALLGIWIGFRTLRW